MDSFIIDRATFKISPFARNFRRLGGSPRVVVLDNLREGVLAADLYEPTREHFKKKQTAKYGICR